MSPFVRRLVERLFEPDSGLSRNRHFHTFDNEEGREALRISRRLKALATDIDRCRASGGVPAITRTTDRRGQVKVELALTQTRARRTTMLEEAEYELLLKLPRVREVLQTG